MAAARQSYIEQDVASSGLRTTYPDGLFMGRQHHVAQVEGLNDDDVFETEDAPEEGDVMFTDGAFDVNSEEVLEEQDAIDVLLSWKQTRANITNEKPSRGLASGCASRGLRPE